MDKILESLVDSFDALLIAQEEGNVPAVPDTKKMGLNHAIVLTNKYAELDKKLEILKFWFETEKNKIERQQSFIKDCCEGFMVNYYEQCGTKHLTLPNGHKFSLRKCPDSINIKDEESVIEWCEENLKEACKTKVSLLKTPIAEYFKKTGNLPPGIEFITGESKGLSFSIG